MRDSFGRDIRYLRLSVTDKCNCRCVYCMPAKGVRMRSHDELMSFEELAEVVGAAAALGITKVRITGGEPLVRRGIVGLVRMVAGVPGVKEVAMTTNATLLAPLAGELRAAGLSRLNISLDSLRPERYRQITRGGELADALAGIEAAREAGFGCPVESCGSRSLGGVDSCGLLGLGDEPPLDSRAFTGGAGPRNMLKINCVLMGGDNDDEIACFVGLARREPFEVRFIELMPMGECAAWPSKRFVSGDAVLGVCPELRRIGTSGVAELYTAPGFAGRVGLIRAVSHRFCAGCDRIRLTADGRLKPCLHSAAEVNLRGLHGDELLRAVQAGIEGKPAHHELEPGVRSSAALRSMNEIGG